MESGGHRSVSGAGVEGASGGLRCHACGYQYPHAHPSAKQRRTHRKHCGKPASAAEEGGAGEGEGRVLFPGEGGGAGGANGIGATAAECGGGLPGSAQEAGSAAVDGDNQAHSSHDGAGAQVIVDKCAEDDRDIASGIAPETNQMDDGGTLNEVAAPELAVSPEQLQDGSIPVLPPEPGYVEGFIPEVSASEMQNSNVVPVPSDATGGEISEQTNDLTTKPDGTTVTGVDTIVKDVPNEEKSVKGSDFDSLCQENLQTKVGEGHSNTAVEEDSSDRNLSAVQTEETPNDEPESDQQSRPMVTSSTDLVPTTEESVKSGTQVPVGIDDFQSETTDTVKPQEQPDSTPVTEDHLAVLEKTVVVDGQHDHIEDGSIPTASSAIGPSVNTEAASASDADNITKDVFSSHEIMGDSVQENVSCNTVLPSQADIVEHSTCSAGHEINMVGSTNDVEEKEQNEKSGADLTTHEMNKVHTTELIEENQQNKEIVADSIPHETDNYGENKKETIAEASSCNIQSTSSIEEKKQVQQVIDNPDLENINVTNNRDIVEKNKQSEVYHDIDVVCSPETIEEKDSTSEINAESITDNAEDKKQNEEISTGDISDDTGMTYSTVNAEKMHNKAMTEDPSSHETVVAHIPDDVGEKYEETLADHTADSKDVVTILSSVEERKDKETAADLSSYGIHATDNVKGENKGEPSAGSVGDVKEKQQIGETTPTENSMPQSTDDAEKGMQSEDTATVPAPEKSEVAHKTNDVEQKGETAAKEISTVESMDDLKGTVQNEEIADKEVIVDSDRSHVSLKVLLADKNVETKEKKPSTKDRVLSFRRRSSKDNESPAKPGSPKAGSGQQDWNSPARLPVEKKPKGKKQQWVPFICCPSIH